MALYSFTKTVNPSFLKAELDVIFPSVVEYVEQVLPLVYISTTRDLTVGEQVSLEAAVTAHDPKTYRMLTKQKLKTVIEIFENYMYEFAAENSEIMYNLGYTTQQKAAAVISMRTKMSPIKLAVSELDFYSIWALFDAVERDAILTDERINKYKASLYAAING